MVIRKLPEDVRLLFEQGDASFDLASNFFYQILAITLGGVGVFIGIESLFKTEPPLYALLLVAFGLVLLLLRIPSKFSLNLHKYLSLRQAIVSKHIEGESYAEELNELKLLLEQLTSKKELYLDTNIAFWLCTALICILMVLLIIVDFISDKMTDFAISVAILIVMLFFINKIRKY